MQEHDAKEIRAETDANFFGLESKGITQIRGNGILLLTTTQLVFGLYKPATDVVIPLSKIVAIDLVKWHLGKSVFRPLFRISFINQDGLQDSAAWLIPDPYYWKTLLEKARSGTPE